MAGKSKFRNMTLEERLFQSREIDPDTGCWLWTKSKNKKGYGEIGINRVLFRVHRVAYELWVGPIAYNVLHSKDCPNKHCFNPIHLYEGTTAENNRDTVEIGTHVSGRESKPRQIDITIMRKNK